MLLDVLAAEGEGAFLGFLDSHTTEILVIATNIAIVVATIWLTKATADATKEGHRHEEVETEKIAKIAHAVIEAEREGETTPTSLTTADRAVDRIAKTNVHGNKVG